MNTAEAAPGGKAEKTSILDGTYYTHGKKWEDERSKRIEISRNVWRTFSLALVGLSILLGAAIYGLAPLKSTEVVTLVVHADSGFVEVARPLEAGGPMSQREAVTQANIVTYIMARETYDPRGLNDNYQRALLYSTGSAWKAEQDEFDPMNAKSPMKVYGPQTTISVQVNSVSFLTEAWRTDASALGTAQVRFQTVERDKEQRASAPRYWVGTVKFRYSSAPMKNQYRFQNPLGFQVVEYRRDQETVGPGNTDPAQTNGNGSASSTTTIGAGTNP